MQKSINNIDNLNLQPDIFKSAALEQTAKDTLDTFRAGQEKNAELINRFFNQPFFSGKESLIDELSKSNPNLNFEDIKDEGINLGLLYKNRMRDFKECLQKINHTGIKNAFKIKLSEKIKNEIGTGAPYDDFDTECPIPPRDTSVSSYFQKIVTYLEGKEDKKNGKKAIEILKGITITNNDLNSILPGGQKIPNGVNLKNHSVPEDTRKAFDRLLSYETGKEANRTITTIKDLTQKLNGLFSNTFPAVNTIISENDELKYDENKLGDEYKSRLQSINNNTNLNDNDKKNQINDLRRNYYLKYLKSKNAKIGNVLEQLYNNNFDYSKIEKSVLKDYTDKVVETRLKMLVDSGAREIIKLDFGNMDEFEDFCKDLADPTKNSIKLNDLNTVSGTANIPIKKTIVKGENQRLKDISQFGSKEVSYDALPIHYEINKSDINNLDLSIEDQTKLLNFLAKYDQGDKYIIEGKDIGMLIYLFFVINNKTPITEFKSDEQEKIQNLFGEAKTRDQNGNQESQNGDNENQNGGNENGESGNQENQDGNNENQNGDNENGENGNQENQNGNNENGENFSPENFKTEIEKLGPGRFENGSEIWLPTDDSELPGGGYQWMKIKIDNIDMKKGTFTGTAFGGELKFKEKYEGKSQEFNMDKDFIKKLNSISKDSQKIWLLPNPEHSNFNTYRNNLKNKGNFNLTFPPEGITRDGNNFTQKIIDKDGKEKETKVKYFGTTEDDKATYKIEYNPIKHSFKVSSSFNGDEKGKDGKTKKKRFLYKRDMDWNNFLIFFAQKGLQPQTEEEANDTLQRQDQDFKMVNGKRRTLNWFSFNNVKNGLTDIFKTLKTKIDEYDKAKTEKFKSSVENPILNALGSFPLLPPSVKNAIGERQQELYNEKNNKAWASIEKYLKSLQSDYQFADTFAEVPSHLQLLWGDSYKGFLEKLRKKSKSEDLSDDEIHKAAALLLANIEKGGSPFRGLTEYENQGFWIRILLGKHHYNQFLRDKQKCINHLKKDGKEKDQIQDALAKCEMEYIMNNVTGANGKLPYFGSHEERGIDGKNKYIANPSQLKLSTQFADKLKDCRDNWFTQSSIDSEFNGIKHNSFDQAREDFYGKFKSSRYSSAIGNLRKMIALTKTEAQKADMQKCFIIYMLSGVLDVYGRKDLRKDAYERGKTMGFLPGMLAKESNNSEKVATLLNDFDPDFSQKVKSYFHTGDSKNGNLKIESLINEVNSRWDENKMQDFGKYAKDFRSKNFPLNSTLNKLQKSVEESGMENINNSILDNPYIANSCGLLSNGNVARDRMSIREGEFEGKNNDEKNNRKEFWNNIAKEVSTTTINVKNTKLLLKQYCDRFQIYDKEKTYKWIKTAYERKELIGQKAEFQDGNGNWDNMGTITQHEINSIIWYTFQGKVMSDHFGGRRIPQEMIKALNAFQEKFKEAFDNNILKDPEIIRDVFGIGNEGNIKPLALGSWAQYNRAVTGRDYISSDNENDPKNRIKSHFKSGNFINEDIAYMEKRLKNLSDDDYLPVTTGTLDNLENVYRAAP